MTQNQETGTTTFEILEYNFDGLTLTIENPEEKYVWNLPAFETWYFRTWLTRPVETQT